MIEAACPLAELATRIADREIVAALVVACGDLADGFASPPDSQARVNAHHRAWASIRAIDRVVSQARQTRRAPRSLIHRAQRAIDRADVLVGALLPN